MTLSLTDQQEITSLVARYCWTIDHFEAEEWAALFTDDGALIASGVERAKGTAGLTAYVAQRRTAQSPKIRHWTTNLIIMPLESDSAALRAYVMAFDIAEGLGTPYVMGEYDDTLRRTSDGWRFQTRRMTVIAGASATGK